MCVGVCVSDAAVMLSRVLDNTCTCTYMYVLITTDSRQAPLHIIYQAHWNWLGRSGHGLTKILVKHTFCV